MAEPFYRFGELVVPSLVAMNGTKFTFRGLENIPQRGGALLAQNHTSYLDWLPPLLENARNDKIATGAPGFAPVQISVSQLWVNG